MASLAPAPGALPTAAIHALPPAGRRKLRVGVFADGPEQPRWLMDALAKVAASDFAEVIYMRNIGVRLQYSGPQIAQNGILESDPNISLDVAFAMGDTDDAALEGLARYGVWRYCFGEGQGIEEPRAGVSEVIEGAPVTASGIRVRVGGADRLAYQSWSRTQPYSVARNRANVFAKASDFLVRALRDLHAAPDSWIERRTTPAKPRAATPRPRAGDFARFGARVARRAVEKLTTVEQWSLAFRFTPEESWPETLAGFHRLAPPKDRFWADPFPIQRGGRSYIFFEELPFAAGKAHISVVEVDRAGRASEPVRVLERDYHLSYPFLVEDAGEVYMIPESAHNDTIEIYRCVDFPAKWRLERVLVDGVYCADATLHREGGRWWMFANSSPKAAEIHDELHLFSADRLLGDWVPHKRNPVKSDVRNARPAGNLFREAGELFRPAQICAPLYGSGVAINRVLHLGHDEYREEEVRRILPAGNGLLGIHTLNRAGDLSVADAFARRSRFGR